MSNLLRLLLAPVVTLILFFILLFTYTKLAGPIPFSVSSVTTSKSDTFNVSGEGVVEVKPDIATVRVGVQANGPTVEATQTQLNTNINQVIEAVKKLGIDSKDIKTENYNVYPNYNDRPLSPVQSTTTQDPKISGYSGNTNLVIKVREVDKANSIVDAATEAGANQVGGVQFEVDDKTQAENEARTKAVADAKKKAEQAAKIAGFRLGKIINYNENFGGYPVPMAFSEKAVDGRGGGTQTDIQPGSNEVRVNVTLSYEVR